MGASPSSLDRHVWTAPPSSRAGRCTASSDAQGQRSPRPSRRRPWGSRRCITGRCPSPWVLDDTACPWCWCVSLPIWRTLARSPPDRQLVASASDRRRGRRPSHKVRAGLTATAARPLGRSSLRSSRRSARTAIAHRRSLSMHQMEHRSARHGVSRRSLVPHDALQDETRRCPMDQQRQPRDTASTARRDHAGLRSPPLKVLPTRQPIRANACGCGSPIDRRASRRAARTCTSAQLDRVT